MAKKELKIRNIDSELLERLNEISKEKNVSRNQLIIETLEQLDPLKHYEKLYAETMYQQAQNTKVLKEVSNKMDKIYEAFLESE